MKILPNEIVDLLDYKTNLQRVLSERSGDFVYFLDNNRDIVITDSKKVYDFIERTTNKAAENIKEIKGIAASKGFAKGRAKVILNPSEFDKMKKGDILVTSMTTPEFVPLMQKSAAVITDIGGLLSHAAIIARELKKPCIIGTKIATKVLKDGDLVEVDADKGIVKIIKK